MTPTDPRPSVDREQFVVVRRDAIERIKIALGMTDTFPGFSVGEIGSHYQDELDDALDNLFAALAAEAGT